MLSMEYDEKKHIEKEKNISYEDGILEGKEQGLLEGKEQGLLEGEMNQKISFAETMLNNHEEIDKIIQYTGLSKEDVLKLK